MDDTFEKIEGNIELNCARCKRTFEGFMSLLASFKSATG